MTLIAEILVALLIVIGSTFALIGSFGLIKLPDLATRLHGPTKATTLGVGAVLIASMIYFTVLEGDFSFHELVITLFLFLTAPLTANFIAKAYLHRHIRHDDLPSTNREEGWATYDPPGEEGPLAPTQNPVTEPPARTPAGGA
ncbi:MAG: Na+/H+ antiporter subunit G [Geminicoccaceae bacterium]|nr:Na+/H+ antiporter subunit G [Geminicoccaceae bacterium]